MSVYLDTSALIKLYVSEPGSADVARWVAVAARVATSRVAYPEARAGLARRAREGALTAADQVPARPRSRLRLDGRSWSSTPPSRGSPAIWP